VRYPKFAETCKSEYSFGLPTVQTPDLQVSANAGLAGDVYESAFLLNDAVVVSQPPIHSRLAYIYILALDYEKGMKILYLHAVIFNSAKFSPQFEPNQA
jgi:hypothetical protein